MGLVRDGGRGLGLSGVVQKKRDVPSARSHTHTQPLAPTTVQHLDGGSVRGENWLFMRLFSLPGS